MRDLSEFFRKNGKAALAFSGGVDSSFLLWAGKHFGADIKAYYVKTLFQPEFELEDAKRLAADIGADMKIIYADVLADENVRSNPADRCYHCKRLIFSAILSAAEEDGYNLVLDGTNASDDADDRPGMKALRELHVRSPLRECGLTKDRIRELSKEAGLFTWDKPAYACLATRIPTGRHITPELLQRTEKAEALLSSMGFSDFRIRLMGDAAKLQIKESQLTLLADKRSEIVKQLGPLYSDVVLDLKVTR